MNNPIGYHWLPLAAIGCHWLPLARHTTRVVYVEVGSLSFLFTHPPEDFFLNGYHWLPLAVIGYHWLPLAASGCQWLPLARGHHHWLEQHHHWLQDITNENENATILGGIHMGSQQYWAVYLPYGIATILGSIHTVWHCNNIGQYTYRMGLQHPLRSPVLRQKYLGLKITPSTTL